MSLVLVAFICAFLTTVGAIGDDEHFSARSVGRSLAKCLGGEEAFACLQKEAIYNLGLVLHDNSTWHCSDFIEFEKDQNATLHTRRNSTRRSNSDSFGEQIAEKLIQIAETRSIRLRVLPRSLDLEAETKDLDLDEGRKKKDKDKGMAMFGGLAMVAMMAQMFLGKVMLIAGSAFVMAKIALMVSLLTSLKTKSSGGGNTEHVVYTDAGGGGGGGHSGGGYSGWHRSLPHYAHSAPHSVHGPIEEEHHGHGPPSTDYYQYEGSTQRQDYKFI